MFQNVVVVYYTKCQRSFGEQGVTRIQSGGFRRAVLTHRYQTWFGRVKSDGHHDIWCGSPANRRTSRSRCRVSRIGSSRYLTDGFGREREFSTWLHRLLMFKLRSKFSGRGRGPSFDDDANRHARDDDDARNTEIPAAPGADETTADS